MIVKIMIVLKIRVFFPTFYIFQYLHNIKHVSNHHQLTNMSLPEPSPLDTISPCTVTSFSKHIFTPFHALLGLAEALSRGPGWVQGGYFCLAPNLGTFYGNVLVRGEKRDRNRDLLAKE